MNKEETVLTLTRLGLTSVQAKIYLTLIELGNATASEIALASKTDRADVYRNVNALQQNSLVEKIITHPFQFRAIPIHDGISHLLKCKHKENAETDKQALKLIEEHEITNEQQKVLEHQIQFIMVPKGTFEIRLNTMLNNTQRNLNVFTTTDRYPKVFEVYNISEALERDVQVRVIVNTKNEHLLEKIANPFKTKSNYELRFLPIDPIIIYVTFDDKEGAFLTSTKTRLFESNGIVFNHKELTQLLVDYFNKQWKVANRMKK